MADSQLTEQKTQRLVMAAIIALVAIGLAASSALLVDYLRPLPLFCSESGGCAQLRSTGWAHMFFGLPTPAVGVAGYAVLAVLTLIRGNVARFVQLVLATFGALAAGLLLFLQFALGTFCVYCMTVDIGSIVLLSVILMRVRAEADVPAGRGALSVAGVFALATALPFLSGALVKPRVPDVIAAEMKKTPPGKVTIVDFIDFECPFCRQTAADFQPVLDKYRGKFRLVRKQMPLTRLHPHAETAARAAVCAETMGKSDEMADALISAPVDQLTDDGCVNMAVGLGLDEKTFRACLAAPETQKKIQSDQAEFTAAHGHGLPFIWIGKHPIEGAEGPDKLREAMDEAVKEAGG